MAIDTGLGATLTALPGSWSGQTVSMQLHTSTLPVVNTSHLGTTDFETVMAGDLKEPGQVTLELQHDHDTTPPVAGDSGTLTLTDAVPSGGSTAANWSGTAIVVSVDHGSRVKNELNTMTVILQWDGGTGPTFTVGT